MKLIMTPDRKDNSDDRNGWVLRDFKMANKRLTMFHKLKVMGSVLAIAVLTASPVFASTSDDAVNFPLRAEYEVVGVKTISTQDLASQFAKFAIVDVRSDYEYHTLHIQDAHSIPLSSPNFIGQVQSLAAKTKKPIVFYCNGTTCSKSYQAGARALEHNIKNTFVYDAGIFAWAKADPSRTILLDVAMKSASQLISKEKLDDHMLAPRRFYEDVMGNAHAIIIDIRDPAQRAGISLFQMRDIHVPLDNDQLKVWIDKAKAENKPLYFVDATGHQVQWLQYFLEEQGVRQYWFMKGGAKAFESKM
jgi:rhodanese-related sulfurtransferase